MDIKLLLLFFLSVLSGVLNRMGGTSLGTKWRDFGVPSCAIIVLLIYGVFHWSLILCFGAMFGSMTTYCKKKGTDANILSWFLVGLMYSSTLIFIPLFAHTPWLGFALRSIAVTSLITLWSQFIGWDVLEEFGRGFIFTSTIPLLFI